MERLLSFAAVVVFALGAVPARAASLSVLNYNLWGAPFAAPAVRERFPIIAREIAGLDVDLVALEEAFAGCFVPDEPGILLRGTRFPYFALGPNRRTFPKCVNSGVMILSKFPIRESARMEYAACAGTDCFAHKGIVYARVAVPGAGDVDVYATHANAELDHGAIRVRQMRQVVEFVRKHSGDGGRPVLFMGDLNAAPGTEEVGMLLKELELRDSHAEFVAKTDVSETERDGFTCDPLRNANLSGRVEQVRQRIDYVLFREARGALAPTVVTDSKLMFEAPAYREKPLSDHFGVRSRFELPEVLR